MFKCITTILAAILMQKTVAQVCSCQSEFLFVKKYIEANYAGFKDKTKASKKFEYKRISDSLYNLTTGKYAEERCLLIISTYLSYFNDDHVLVGNNFANIDMRLDSSYLTQRQRVVLADVKLNPLRNSSGYEGIYFSKFDTAYKIAVLKDKTILHDYIGVILDSKLKSWKKGMVKFESKQVKGNYYKGVLYMRNHLPKIEWFYKGTNTIGGDWQREGTERKNQDFNFVPDTAHSLNNKTFYIKISSFSPSNAAAIDSMLNANKSTINTTPNLIIDIRGNGGGADFVYSPLLPYLYTNPIKGIGVDVLSTNDNITAWEKLLDEEDMPESNKSRIQTVINIMQKNPGKMVNIADDYVDSPFTQLPFPKKIIILIDNGCASTTEQFLLAARQSKKVILAGQNTSGTLDYSNMRAVNFSCLPYTLKYSTTRSRRLNSNNGIDGIGIKPDIYLKEKEDWIKKAVKILTE
jgi:hypothetical protein